MANPSADAAFTRGSTMSHIVRTTLYGAVGMFTLFSVDLLDLYFISLLGVEELAAAVGYAGTLLFYTTSLGIGLGIATAAMVARTIGAGDRVLARRIATHAILFNLITTIPVAIILWIFVPDLLRLLGATGETLDHAIGYTRIIVPSMPILGLAMAAGGVLRATARPQLAMASTIAGGIANAALDPLLIFGLGLDLTGAAIASVAARFVVLGVAGYGVIKITDMLGPWCRVGIWVDLRRYYGIALPAMATNLATPFANSVVIATMSSHGPEAVAGYTVIARLVPVAFGAIFALSGAIGPIVGQNFGAGNADRVRRALWDSLIFITIVCGLMGLLLFLGHGYIVAGFDVGPVAGSIIGVFTGGGALLFIFQGALFCSNAAFNNLGRPLWSTAMNWGRATLGTIPVVWAGDRLMGAEGVILGQMIGALPFGIGAFILALNLANHAGKEKIATKPAATFFRIPLQALSTVMGYVPNRLRAAREED